MSSYVGNAFGAGLALYPDDKANCDEAFFANDELFQPDPLVSIRQRNDPADFFGASSFRSPWWPCSGQLLGDGAADVPLLVDRPARWGDIWYASGANGRLAISGVTCDQYFSPVGGVTVKLFRTLDDSLQASVVSEPDGSYLVTTPYSDAHYLVIYKSGTPDLFGTTVNTLVAG